MQWYLFANISDNSWLYAYNCLENKSRFNVIDIGSNIGAFTLKLAKKCYENKKNLIFTPSNLTSIFLKLLKIIST